MPLLNNLQCSVPELTSSVGWTRQRLVMPEPQAQLKEVSEVGGQVIAEGFAALKKLVSKIHYMQPCLQAATKVSRASRLHCGSCLSKSKKDATLGYTDLSQVF